MKRALILTAMISCLLVTFPVAAKSVEAGSVWLGGQVGLDFKMGGRVGGSDTLLAIGGEVEYALDSQIGIFAGGVFGLGDTQAIRIRTGAKYRFGGMGFPISPYVSGHLQTSHLMDVMGANLWAMSAGFGGGVDYFLTRHLTAGLDVSFSFGGTLGERSTGYDSADVLLTARYAY